MEKESSVVGVVDGDRQFAEEFYRERRDGKRSKQSYCSCDLLILRSIRIVNVVAEAAKGDKDNFPSKMTLIPIKNKGGDAIAHGENCPNIRMSPSLCRGESSGIGELNHASAVDECVPVK